MSRRFRRSFVCNGPFCKPAFEHYRVSPIGVTTGKYSHKKRLILDLSSPHSDDVASINDLIDKGQCSMSYIKIDDAVKRRNPVMFKSWFTERTIDTSVI
jgi:hypothetical protein